MSLAISPTNPNFVVVGYERSKDVAPNASSSVYSTSTDAGRTWQFMGLKDSGQIGAIVVHPANPDIVWLAALGSPFGPNQERGIFKTADGGKTWKKTLFVNEETGGRVVAVNYANPNELYAGMYRGFRKGWDIISGGPASEGGIFKSTDGGETWSKLSTGLPSTLIGKIDISIARSQPSTVYAMVDNPDQEKITQSIKEMEQTVNSYVPGYRLRAEPLFDGNKVTVFVEVEGAGDYLPTYSGNLDIMTAAAVKVGEEFAKHLLAKRGEAVSAGA